MCTLTCRACVRCSVFALAAAVLGGALSACSAPPAYRAVVDQNTLTTAALADSASRFAAASERLLKAHSSAVRAAARERVAQDLVRFAIADPASVLGEIGSERNQLRARLDLVPVESRAEAARSLASQHPAIIDIAISTAGFTPERVLADAQSLDALNAQIDAETSPPVRAALLANRDTLLDAYLPARIAHEDADAASGALARSLTELETQKQLALIHASALIQPASTDPASFQTELASLLSDLGVSTSSPDAQERIRRINAALEAISRLASRSPN